MKITLQNINDVFKSEKAGIETMELKGYSLIREYFVDSSGLGQENEPAWTIKGFLNELETILKKHNTVYTTLTNVGQFQVYVGIFEKCKKEKATKRLAKNVIRYSDGKTKILRLYDTDIFRQFENGDIQLNTGGFYTQTTKRWINKYLPDNLKVIQIKGSWYIYNSKTDENIPFKEGIIL